LHTLTFVQLPGRFKQVLIDWFTSVSLELMDHIRQGCGRYQNWQEAITGSKKSSRRKGETLELILTLEQTKYTVRDLQTAWAVFTNFGHGDNYLLSPPLPLEITGMFNDIPGEIEQATSHVSGPLSYSYDTWEGTSGSELSDLFPDLQTLDVSQRT
jgi:hypothetical protein